MKKSCGEYKPRFDDLADMADFELLLEKYQNKSLSKG